MYQLHFLYQTTVTCHLVILKYIKIALDELIINGKLTKNNIKKTYNSDTAFNNVINDIASNIADGESANFSFLIDKRDYYFGYLSKYASNIYGGYFVSLGGVNYKFTSAIGAVEV